jgi:aconitate hydratase 2/2-methylisocitrate dehydratase
VEAAGREAPPAGGYTLAQKLVGRACGRAGVLPGETCEPGMSTVGSQDTTGPMTRDELTELACLRFQADLVMQSFCHTAAYPTGTDAAMHAALPEFITSRGGVALRPGDGIIHSWLNRMLLPDTVGTGGDSHTRFPLGISFPAGSGLVAFAAALGSMPLDMPESVLVRLEGARRAGITLRDVVNAIPLEGIRLGLVDRPGEGGRNVFNSRIQEIEGTEGLTVEEAFELSCASAGRSAAAPTGALSEGAVAEYLRSNAQLLRRLLGEGYADGDALRRRLADMEAWLAEPSLLRRDATAAFHEEMTLDLGAVAEPVLACPNNPDNVRPLSEVAGTAVDEVFLGSCMTNIGHFRMAARILDDAGGALRVKRLWATPPTRMDRDRLEAEGVLEVFRTAGARIEIPGCSLCMGNQARVDDDAVVVSTSTRNFDNRMGRGAQVYLASAVLAALTAVTGRLPEPEAYFAAWERAIGDDEAALARPLDVSRPETGEVV